MAGGIMKEIKFKGDIRFKLIFITSFCIVGISYLMTVPLNGTPLHVFPLPLSAMLWGIALGAIGSSTGDVHYGAESEYQ